VCIFQRVKNAIINPYAAHLFLWQIIHAKTEISISLSLGFWKIELFWMLVMMCVHILYFLFWNIYDRSHSPAIYMLTMMMVVHSYDELKIYIWRFSQNNEFNIILHTDFSFACTHICALSELSFSLSLTHCKTCIEKNDFKCIVIGLMTF
jgi:hypothetical protein